MTGLAQQTSKITDKGQTTVPKPVRDALGLRAGDRVAFDTVGDQIVIRRVSKTHKDPQLAGLLALFDRDIAARRNLKTALPAGVTSSMKKARAAVKVKPDQPLRGDVAL